MSLFPSILMLLASPNAGEFSFQSKEGKVSIDPATLAVRTGSVVLSAGQSSQRVAGLERTANRAKWELPDEGITVSMRLDGDALAVDFTAKQAGEFTWPVLPARRENRAYLLPLGEGAYVPVGDAAWGDYLVGQEGISTTEGLSMPVWGIDDGKRTISYLLTNPFNNELTFSKVPGNLAARLTHRFTRLNAVKTYGVRISLGPSSPIEPARQYRRWLVKTGQFLTMREKIRRTPEAAKLLGAAHAYLWGDGASPEMMEMLHANGFDRLWLGAPDWKLLLDSPATVKKAKAFGYLIGPYDSYDSVHSPDAKPDETWETAQFDQKLFDTGGIVLASGKLKSGFQGKGYYVSERMAEPYVRERVPRLMKAFDCNSWFIDCDAAGEFYDDFSPAHPASQAQEARARLERMAWIRDTFHVVIGSEGGAAYAAGTIHFAHGMMSKPFGWGDPDLKDPESRYFLGAYYPPTGPDIFLKPAAMKPVYEHVLFDPRFRLPLYQATFHDSVITTHHWSLPTLKFSDQVTERALLEELYNVPPMLHFNRQEFARHGAWMKAQFAFFSPLHRKAGLLPMTDFGWLTADRLVQRTRFGANLEMVANFGSAPFKYEGRVLAGKSVVALDRGTGKVGTYRP